MNQTLTPENSFVCEECEEHQFDGNMAVLSLTRWFKGLICIDCAAINHPKELEKAIAAREKKERKHTAPAGGKEEG